MTVVHEPAQAARRRRPLRDVLLTCLIVLLLAQGLVGSLSLSALNCLTNDNTSDRIELFKLPTSSPNQSGLQLSKTFNQVYGLSALRGEVQDQVPDLAGASVVLMNGQELASVGMHPKASRLLQAFSSQAEDQTDVIRLPSGAVRQADEKGLRVGVPLLLPDGSPGGMVVLQLRAQ